MLTCRRYGENGKKMLFKKKKMITLLYAAELALSR